VLTRLNTEILIRQGRTTRFATAVYALINCRSRVMQLAGAGHPPPSFSMDRAMEGATPLETTGGLLGVFDDDPYEQIEVELAVEDRVLFYSDGFEQAFPKRGHNTYERMLPTMRYRQEFDEVVRNGVPQQVIERLRERLDAQSGSLHQADDLTMICAHIGPLHAPDGAAAVGVAWPDHRLRSLNRPGCSRGRQALRPFNHDLRNVVGLEIDAISGTPLAKCCEFQGCRDERDLEAVLANRCKSK
jgi:hypothetical protein